MNSEGVQQQGQSRDVHRWKHNRVSLIGISPSRDLIELRPQKKREDEYLALVNIKEWFCINLYQCALKYFLLSL
jgi:hypothetical protein